MRGDTEAPTRGLNEGGHGGTIPMTGILAMARRLMAGHRSLEPAVVVRIHPGQFLSPSLPT